MPETPPTRVLGVLNGTDMPSDQLRDTCRDFETIFATDGAANTLAALSIPIDGIIGDMDSVSSDVLSAAPSVVCVPDQDRSDCDKLLAHVAALGHHAITLTNLEGDRPDHFLATLASCGKSPLEIDLIFRQSRGWIVRGERSVAVDVEAGRLVSLIPLARCENVSFTGVRWPVHEAMALDGLVSLSNRAEGPISVRVGTGFALLVVHDVP